MVAKITKISPKWLAESEVKGFLKLLKKLQVEAKFVGGCVRDTLLHLPVSDLDMAVAYPAAELYKLLQDNGCKVIPTGLEHGTLTVVLANRHLEITSLRADVETDGRHAKVEFINDWEADAQRRDFTINAIYLDADGTIFDPLQGRTSLQQKEVKFIGNPEQRIQEDYLRILRFFRFSATFAQELDKQGLACCRKLRAGMKQLAAERIRAEIKRILVSPNLDRSLQLMAETKILNLVFPTPINIRAVSQVHAMANNEASSWLVLLVALGERKLGWVKKVAKRFVLSRAEKQQVLAMTNELPSPLTEEEVKKFVYQQGKQCFFDCLALDLIPDSRWQELRSWELPVLPITGYDVLPLLTKQLKKGEKKIIGQVLAKVEQFWLDSNFLAKRDACLLQAENLINEFLKQDRG